LKLIFLAKPTLTSTLFHCEKTKFIEEQIAFVLRESESGAYHAISLL